MDGNVADPLLHQLMEVIKSERGQTTEWRNGALTGVYTVLMLLGRELEGKLPHEEISNLKATLLEKTCGTFVIPLPKR